MSCIVASQLCFSSSCPIMSRVVASLLFRVLSVHFTAFLSDLFPGFSLPNVTVPNLLWYHLFPFKSRFIISSPCQLTLLHSILFRFSSFMTTPCQHNWSPCISDSCQHKSFLIQFISELDNSHSFPSIRSYPYHLRYFPGKSIPFLVLSCPHTSVSYRLVTPQFLAAKLRIKSRTFHTTTFIPNLIFSFSQNTLKRMKRTSATWTTISD